MLETYSRGKIGGKIDLFIQDL